MVRATVRRFDTRFFVAVLTVSAVLLVSQTSDAGLLDYFRKPLSGQKSAQTPVGGDMVSEGTQAPTDFIVPNEFDNYLHFSELSPATDGVGRAVISVGTLRAFNLAGYMERDYLISFDYAPGIAQFNKALANLIARYDRLELLRLLLLDSQRLDVKPGESERQALRDRLAEREATGDLDRVFQQLGSTSDPDLKIVYGFLANGKTDRPNWRPWLKSIVQFTASHERYDALFLGNDRAYNHLQKMIRAGRFHALTGSISGDKAIKSISTFLKDRNLVVSEFDPSNALEHVVRAEKEKGIAAFSRNVEEMPFAGDGRVLVTVDTRFMTQQEQAQFPSIGTWHYAVYKPSNLVARLEGVRDDLALVKAYASAGGSHSVRPASCHTVFQPL